MKEKTREILCAVLFFAFGLYWYLEGGTYQKLTISVNDVGPSFVPKLLGGALMALSVVLLATTLMKYRKAADGPKEEKESSPGEEEQAPKNQADMKGGFLSMALLVVFALLIKPVGFIITSAVYLFFQILVFSYQKEKQTVIPAAVVSIAAPVAIYLIWYYVFKVPLPAGILPLHLWL